MDGGSTDEMMASKFGTFMDKLVNVMESRIPVSPIKGGMELPGEIFWYDWLAGSGVPSLGDKVKVDKGRAIADRANPFHPSGLEAVKSLTKKATDEKLLNVLTDEMSTLHYPSHRQHLAQLLYSYALTGTSSKHGESLVKNALVGSLEWASRKRASDGFTKLAAVHGAVSLATDYSVSDLFLALDREFVSPSKMVGYNEYLQAGETLRIEDGFKPSQAFQHLLELASRHLQQPLNSEQVLLEATCRFASTMATQRKRHAFLEPFMSKLADPDFADSEGVSPEKAAHRWMRVFRSLESTGTFVENFAAAVKSSASSKGRDKETAPRRGVTSSAKDETVGLVAKLFADVINGGENDSNAALAKVLAAIKDLKDKDKDATATATATATDIVTAMVAEIRQAVGGDGGGGTGLNNINKNGGRSPLKFDDEWVAEHGVVGQKAPWDSRRPQLHTFKILEKLGIKVEGFEMPAAGELAGDRCPFCRERVDEWFYRPGTKEFFDNGSRVRPPGVRRTGWHHDVCTCSRMYEQLHRYVKANPSEVGLFDPLPPGQDHRRA